MQHHGALLLWCLHCHEPHRRPRNRFTDRFCIGSIILATLDVGLHVLSRHQPNIMPQRDQLAGPIMRGVTRLHPDQASRQLLEERQDTAPAQAPPHHHFARRIDPVHLKHRLRDIQPDRRNGPHPGSPSRSTHDDYRRSDGEPSTTSEADGLLWRVRDGKADLRAPDVRRVHRRTSPRQADRTRGPRGLRAGKKVKLVPQVEVFALLVNPNSSTAERVIQEVQQAARAKGVQLHVLKASIETEIDAAFASVVQLHAGALVVSPDPILSNRRDQLVALASRHAIPSIYAWREFAASGGLVSYGASLTSAFHLLGAYYADKPPFLRRRAWTGPRLLARRK